MMYRILRPFRRSHKVARALYPHIVEQARQTVFYEDYAVEDDLQGRFNILSLHLYMVLERLNEGRDEHKLAKPVEQDLIDIFFDDMDTVIRQMGTGDMGVGHKVKKLANQFYGRFKAYQEAKSSEDFGRAVTRNIYKNEEHREEAERLGHYATALREALAGQPIKDLLDSPEFPDAGAC